MHAISKIIEKIEALLSLVWFEQLNVPLGFDTSENPISHPPPFVFPSLKIVVTNEQLLTPDNK